MTKLPTNKKPMLNIRVEHRLNCSTDTFWSKIFFDQKYNQRLCIEHLKFVSWREVAREERDGHLHRLVDASPPLPQLPGPLSTLFGKGTGFEERGVFDREIRQYRAQIIPSRLADRIRVQIEVSALPDGPQHCTRIATAQMSAQLFGVGGLLENVMIADFRDSYEKSAEFTNQFIAEQSLG